MHKSLKIGILGCANIADKYIVPALKQLPDKYFLHTISSRESYKADLFQKKFNFKYASTYHDLINNDEIDIVYIPLPNSLHFEYGEKLLNKKKHLIVEKSLGLNKKQVTDLLNIAKTNGLVVFENFQFQFHRQFQKIKELISSGILGELRHIRSSFCFPPFKDSDNIRYSKVLGGGALLDAGAYPIKLASLLLGNSASISDAVLNFQKKFEVDIWGSGSIIERETGVIFQFSFGFDNYYQCNLEILGSKGKISTDRIYTAPPGLSTIIKVETNNFIKEIKIEPDNHFINMLTYVHNLVINGKFDQNNLNLINSNLLQSFMDYVKKK